MPLRSVQYSFTAGELSPRLGGRVDINRYFAGLAVCQNYRTLSQGGVEKRAGTLFVARAKYDTRRCRLERFEFSVEQAYILEIGHLYIRFYADLGRLESPPGTPVEVATPYNEADLFALQMTQSADVLYIVHPDYPPAKLLRLSHTSWEYKVIPFRPMPAADADTDLGTTLTPGATTGTGVTFTAGSAVFLDGDVDRQIRSGDARAVITALGGTSPSATVICTILVDFPSTAPITAGQWVLEGSPVVDLEPDKAGPQGALVTLSAQRTLDSAPEMLVSGGFDEATGWDDLSGPTVASGTTTDPAPDPVNTTLVDTGATFMTAGVEVAHIAYNTTDGTQDRVEAVVSQTKLTTATAGASWPAGKAYTIRQTGTASITAGELRLDGGENGVGWRRQTLTTVAGRSYRLAFDVRENPVAVLVGTTATGSELAGEATYQVGNEHEVTFVATGATTYVHFRNNQDQQAVVDNATVKNVSAQAFRSQDVEKLLTIAGGTVEVTGVLDASTIVGIVWDPLDADTLVNAGAWTLGVKAWSAERGYPRAVSFHQGRLCFGGTTQQPLTVWLSVSGEFEQFTMGSQADDAMEIELSANHMNTIEWMEPFSDLFVGTRGGEHLVLSAGPILKPDDVGQVPQGTTGSPPLRPVRVDATTIVHVERGFRRLYELTLNEESTRISRVRDLTLLAEHILSGGVTQLAYQRQPIKTLWAVRSDGQLVGLTMELLEEVRGWHRHTTAGAFESVAILPVDDAQDTDETEQLWCVVRREIAGATRRFIEVARPGVTTQAERLAALTVDCALAYAGAPATTFSGLDHLEGAAVRLVQREAAAAVTLAGETVMVHRLTDLGSQVVSGGEVETPYAVEMLDVGLHFDAHITTLRPEIPADDGTLQMRKRRWAAMHARLIDSVGLTVGGVMVPMRDVAHLMDTGLEPEDVDVKAAIGEWTTDGRVTFAQTLPFPSTILLVSGELEYEEAE